VDRSRASAALLRADVALGTQVPNGRHPFVSLPHALLRIDLTSLTVDRNTPHAIISRQRCRSPSPVKNAKT